MVPTLKVTAGSHRILAGNRELSPETFAPFGEVIQNPATHNGSPSLQRTEANQGSATKWLDVTHMTNFYEQARKRTAAKAVVNMFVCKPRKLRERNGRRFFSVEILERHPFTPQTFIPLGLSAEDDSTRYLVIVAPTLPHGTDGRRLDLFERIRSTWQSPTSVGLTATTRFESDREESGLPDLDNIQVFVARGDQAVTYSAGTWHAPMVVLGDKDIEFVVVQYANGVAGDDCQEVAIAFEDGGDALAVDVGNIVRSKAKL